MRPAPLVALACSCFLLTVTPAEAQSFDGTFTVPNDAGGLMTVTLRQSADGSVSGTMVSNGVTLELHGEIQEGTATGRVSGPTGAMWFEADRWENELWLTLYGSDASGQPDYQDYTEIDLVAAGQPGAMQPSQAGAAPSGAAAQPGGGGRTSTGRELAPGFTENHPMVQEWETFLAGKKVTRMESYTSGLSGGYSSRTDVYLCSDRRFAMRDENSVSVDVGGASGNAGGLDSGQGTWYLITNGQVVGLILEFANGQVEQYRMDFDPQSQATYANGERVYVTAAEICY